MLLCHFATRTPSVRGASCRHLSHRACLSPGHFVRLSRFPPACTFEMFSTLLNSAFPKPLLVQARHTSTRPCSAARTGLGFTTHSLTGVKYHPESCKDRTVGPRRQHSLATVCSMVPLCSTTARHCSLLMHCTAILKLPFPPLRGSRFFMN